MKEMRKKVNSKMMMEILEKYKFCFLREFILVLMPLIYDENSERAYTGRINLLPTIDWATTNLSYCAV
jgi:hypothetical protein